MERRVFLFLQGVCSPFFARLADRLVADGHQVLKVNFNVGDWMYWAPRPAVSFRQPLSMLSAFLGDLYARYGVTDQILFGDCRPVHRPAVEKARGLGIRTHVFEEGYFRPFWVTLEREGVNSYSRLPRDPDWYRALGPTLPEYGRGKSFVLPFRVRAGHDVAYHLAGALNPLLFPNYRTHHPDNAALQYLGYMHRLPMLRLHAPRDTNRIYDLIQRGKPFYVLPLQMNGDAQIRDHSRFRDMEEVMWFVMDSFAPRAPGDAHLVIKNHPLDYGLVPHARTAAHLSRHFGLQGRVHYLETGNLRHLLQRAHGTVTVNSTVGSVALGHVCPTICLASPIYDLPGLTFQGELDDFWRERQEPDMKLFRYFRSAVIHTTQVNGGFYSRAGIEQLVENCLPRLLAEQSVLETLLPATQADTVGSVIHG
ncbi:MAG: capsule biosynthesis protein CapA [Candidatus Dactylopiibacterium carminicum]|uniref:Capsule biosynthesis protein CapA n=1 Tax=Candidatus Dactylopiibacterium carminicum TaxID=857335 RepID=A0A272ESP0_9RHOO|nr:capsular biosynthesis protein [Candidatus Dactylopiibacterium carminicum]KAF7599115.1 capsule biosynthesis protein CapA [Candidatus Dactylopiibacterium carminicum]PAS93124.1 MAG: capsule biosynthesis protein CapA [Candidatus Dactylopiibacterium carminicum]PAS96904.1 MAG: capsule biosynthesis protein CapA [Candidatus Dactylopiibacterium carminicum]